MKTQPRWIGKTIEAAEACNHKMPWERGTRRAEFIARRSNSDEEQATVSLAPVPSWLTEAISA